MAGRNVFARIGVQMDADQARRELESINDGVSKLGNARLDTARTQFEQLGASVGKTASAYQPLTEAQRRAYEQREDDVQQIGRLQRSYATLGGALAAVDVQVQHGHRSAQDAARIQSGLIEAYSKGGAAYAAANDKASTSAGQFRGAIGGLGLQLQDVIVQAQMGTNAFVILAQQGSQAASMFGPLGAAIGTGIALFGALGAATMSAGGNAEDATTAFNDYGKALEFTAKMQDELARATRGQADAMAAEKRNIIEVRKEALRLAEARLLAARAAADEEEGDGLHTGTGISQSARQSAANRLGARWKDLRNELEILKANAGDYNGMVDRMVQQNQRAETGVTTLGEEIAKARQGIVEQTKALGLEADTFGKSNAEKLRATLTQQMMAKEYKTSADQLSEATKRTINDAVAQQERIDKLEAQKKAQEDATRAGEQAARQAEQEERKHQQAMRTADVYVDRLRGESDGLKLTERERFIANKALELEHQLRGKLSPELLAEYVRQVEYEAGALYDATDARKQKQKADEEAVRALEAYQREMQAVADDIARDWSETLYDSIVLKDKQASIIDSFRDLFKRIAIEAIKAQIVLPITTSIVGSVPGLFGISSPANQNAAGQGGMGGLTGQATDMATNWGTGKALSWAGDKLGITGGFDALMNTPVWGSAVSMSSTGAAAYTGTLVANPALAGPGLVQAGSLNAANGVVNSGNTAALNASYSGTTTGASGTAGATLGGVLGTAGAGFAAGSLIGGWAGTSTNSKVVGGLSGAASGAAAGAAMGTWAFPGVGTVIGALIGGGAGGLGGLIGTQKASVGPNAQGNVVVSGGRFAEGPSAADNKGDATGVRQATAQIAAAMNAMVTAYGLRAPDGTYGLFTGGDKVKGNGVRTPEELIRQLVGSLSADGLVGRALGADVVKGSTDLEQINRYLSLAKNISNATTALSDLDKSLAGVQKAAFKASADALWPMVEQLQQAAEIGATAEYKAVVSGQLGSMLDDIANPKTWTATQTAVASLTGQLAAMKSIIERVNPELAATVDTIQEAALFRLRTDVNRDLDRRYNDGFGRGYINQVSDALSALKDDRTNLLTLGQSDAKAYTVFFAGLRSIFSGLDAAQLDDVSATFGEAATGLTSFVEEMKATSSAAKEAAEAQERQAAAMQKLTEQADSLTAWLSGQALGDTSSLSPWAKMEEAQRQFDAALSTSRQNGDISGATKAADALLSASKPTLVMGTEAYTQREAWITSTLKNLGHELGLPGFATGGDHLGGLRIVGERGPELEWTGPSRIFSADQTRQILAGATSQAAPQVTVNVDMLPVMRAVSQSTNEVVTELRRLRQEVADLRAEKRTGINLKLAGVG